MVSRRKQERLRRKAISQLRHYVRRSCTIAMNTEDAGVTESDVIGALKLVLDEHYELRERRLQQKSLNIALGELGFFADTEAAE